MYHESGLEHRVSMAIQTWNGVKELHSQYPRVTYVDADGKERAHTFDFFVVYDNGQRLAIAVKAHRKRAMMIDLLSRIAAAGMNGQADATLLMTERDVSHEAFYNAADILASRDISHAAESVKLSEIIDRMLGTFRLATLLVGSTDLPARRAAIWKMIGDGVLVPTEPGRINDLTWLTRSPSAQLAA